jgi:hypothetical protein
MGRLKLKQKNTTKETPDGSFFYNFSQLLVSQIPIGAATRPVTLSALLVLTAVREPGPIIAMATCFKCKVLGNSGNFHILPRMVQTGASKSDGARTKITIWFRGPKLVYPAS